MSNIADYRIKIIIVPDSKYYYQGKENKVFVKIYKTKKAEANKVRYPGTKMVRTFISLHCPYVKNYEEVTLYWTGQTFIEGTEYELKLANLQKQWRKKQAESKHDSLEIPAHLKLCRRVRVWTIKADIEAPSRSVVNKQLQLTEDAEVIHLYWTGKRFISKKLCLYYMRSKIKADREEREATVKATVEDVLRFLQEDRRSRQGVTQ